MLRLHVPIDNAISNFKHPLTYSDVISQVDFVDSHGLSELSAVELDPSSRYMAEETSFIGFETEVRGVQ